MQQEACQEAVPIFRKLGSIKNDLPVLDFYS